MANKSPISGFATRAIHAGNDSANEQGALVPPVYMTSTFAFDTAEAGGEMFAGNLPGHFYSRVSNPTLDLLERRLADLEGADAALSTASGIGAITSTLWTILEAGDELVVDQTLYGCTFAFFQAGLTKFGIRIVTADLTDPENLAAAITPKTKAVYFETPANPNMRLVDIRAVSAIAHGHGALVIVDNTYATPYLTRPIALGADIVVHSATKYLGGHGDLIAGLVAGPEDLIRRIRLEGLKNMTGAVMAPLTAFLVMRGLKTLEIRMDRHCASAQKVAEWLADHPAVKSISYPGLDIFPQRELALCQMSQPGGMIAFELKDGLQAGITFMNRLKMIKRAVSLGDAETLIQHPASMTHSTYTPQERARHGISEGLVRLSVGLETADDIMADLSQAFNLANRHFTPAKAMAHMTP